MADGLTDMDRLVLGTLDDEWRSAWEIRAAIHAEPARPLVPRHLVGRLRSLAHRGLASYRSTEELGGVWAITEAGDRAMGRDV